MTSLILHTGQNDLFIFTTKDKYDILLVVINMTLLEIRTEYGLSQIEAAQIVNVPIRTFRRYETDDTYGSSIKRNAFISAIEKYCEITEEKGLLTIEQIKNKISDLFENEYKGQIDFCYLFGSYAKGTAKENSDVDLYVSSNLTGIRFVGLIERIRQKLHKKVDLLRSSELENNIELVNEILKGGIKIYG